jgi:hypothetical protein
LAAAVYVMVGLWTTWFVLLVLRRDPVPPWVLVVDVAVTVVGVVVLPWAARTPAFTYTLANPDLEPITVTVAIAVAMITASIRWTAAACLALGVGYTLAQGTLVQTASEAVSMVSTVCWQVGAGCCAVVFIRRLHGVARSVDAATEQVMAARERVAVRRTHAEARVRHFHEQVRRYRAVHDGPLRILTAVAGPGPAAHPDPELRRQCAVSVNVLRGAIPHEAGGTLTDLSLALMEAGTKCAAYGLLVEYHFANLPDDLPCEVVRALSLAAAEALSNVSAHAGTNRVRLSALSTGGPDRPAVTVAIVDQGSGFAVTTVRPGYGIRHSIIARMSEIGGQATVDSHPGQGTRVDLRWPR